MIILDTAIWIALLKSDDSCHELAKNLVKNISPEGIWLFDHVYIESMTVLRNKSAESKCWNLRKFFEDSKIQIILTNEAIFSLANSYFFLYTKLSFVDALILASAKLNHLQLITFDKELQKAWANIS